MSTDSAAPLNPTADEFAGDSPSRVAKRLFHATRPKFFPASILPVLVGTGWGIAIADSFDGIVFLLALLATVCVHAGSNVINDVTDDKGGTDRQNEGRIYPYTGGSRFIQTGILDSSSMMRLGVGLLVVAAIAGVLLIVLKGMFVLYLGMAGMALGILYSIEPVRLNALGLGESAVAIAFGVLPVAGAAWLQGAAIGVDLLLFSVPVSAWVAAILLINEVPDIQADGATGKRTLPVRLGLGGTASLYMAIHAVALISVVLLVLREGLPILAPVVPLLLLVLAARAAKAIQSGADDRGRMTTAIESTLAIHTVGSLWLIACMIFLIWQSAG
jgi:1,4-dihydroxy-2-naphthoate octaprenyltransferase